MDTHTASFTPPARLAYSPREVAESLGLSLTSVRRYLESGALASTRIGARVLIPAAEVERLLTVHPHQEAA